MSLTNLRFIKSDVKSSKILLKLKSIKVAIMKFINRLSIILTILLLASLSFAACDGKNTSGGNGGNGGGGSSDKTYTVTIKVNEESYGTVSRSKIENVTSGTIINVIGNELIIGDVTITATAAEGEGEDVYVFENFTDEKDEAGGNITITANFIKTKKRYKVTFMANGEEYGEGIMAIKGEKITAPATDPTKPSDGTNDYAFNGWYYGDDLWDFENGVVAGEMTLTAAWRITSTYSGEFLPDII